MDVDDEEAFTRKCFKCEEPVLDSFDLVYNSSNSKLFLWNKYQIIIYKDDELEYPQKIFVPEFQIHLIIASNNYLLCLDTCGNVHIASLKFKSSTQKTLKISLQPRDNGIKTCVRYKEDKALSLKYEADAYFLCLNRINTDFKLEKQVILLCNDEHWPLEQHSRDKCLITFHSVSIDNLQQYIKIFKIEESAKNITDFVLISLDRLTVFGCLFSAKMIEEEVNLVRLYNSPDEICDIIIDNLEGLNIQICLKMGTIVTLNLNVTLKSPAIVHLNTSLYKMLALKNCLIYTDGATMWKAENIHSKSPILTQFFLRNVKDFIKCGDQIVCTTFSRLIYKFSVEDRNAYLTAKINDEYCSAEKLFNNSAYLNKLFEEIDKNNEIVRKLQKEQDHITALSLTRRQDVVNKAIESKVSVFEHYEEVEAKDCTLTEAAREYFDINTWLFLVTITNSNIYDILNNILSNLSEHIRIFITLSSTQRFLKTTCIKMVEALKTVNYLIPLHMTKIKTEINVNIKIIINIPGALNQKMSPTILYRNDILLRSEHFIKTSQKTAVRSLKDETESIEQLITKFNTIQFGNLFQFTEITKLKSKEQDWNFYIKLPNNYERIFKYKSSLNTQKLNSILQHMNNEEFLKSKKHITFMVGNQKLNVKIQNDGFSNPLLKVTCSNAKIALHLRIFFANVLYNGYEDYEPGKEFISYSFYTSTENIQKAVNECIKNSGRLEEFLPLMDHFEKNIVGVLPL